MVALAGLAQTSSPFTRAARAGIDPLSGVDLVTITHPGNAPWAGNGMPGDQAIGRGRVDYEYRIGRFEVNTAQFAEFFNAAFDRPANDRIPHLIPPTFWGAVPTTPTVAGGMRWRVPAGREMRAVGNIDWRMAAIYCNWLHNGKALSREAFLSGAYEVSTFGYTGPNGDVFTDQAARSPGARYFIPTWDEWLKAAHWSPDKDNTGEPGWYLYPHTSDTPLVYGPPGVGQANAGYVTLDNSEFLVPLGAYPDVQSPWGLFDLAGATSEWTESIVTNSTNERFRVFDGTRWASTFANSARSDDWLGNLGAEYPSFSLNTYGFRLAAVVPSPTSWLVLGVAFMFRNRNTRQERHPCTDQRRSCASQRWRRRKRGLAMVSAMAALAPAPAWADVDPVSGIDFVRIGALGNAAWPGDGQVVQDRAIGRGGVNYEYHIGRFEWTTAQAVEFFNAAFDRPANDQLPHLIPPRFWGGVSATPTVPGGQRWRVQAGGAMLPVGDISWRMAAMYCNWLHNGKATNREAFLDGAYDVSTFTYTGTVFNDQPRHHPDARYWIPTWDEWLKAAHYDPAKDNGDGTTGGWWIYPNGSDTPLVYGPPGALVNGVPTQANGPWSQSFPGANPFGVLLGAYTNAPSPWGCSMSRAGLPSGRRRSRSPTGYSQRIGTLMALLGSIPREVGASIGCSLLAGSFQVSRTTTTASASPQVFLIRRAWCRSGALYSLYLRDHEQRGRGRNGIWTVRPGGTSKHITDRVPQPSGPELGCADHQRTTRPDEIHTFTATRTDTPIRTWCQAPPQDPHRSASTVRGAPQ